MLVLKTLADNTPSKIDESQNPVSEHFSLPKSFRKPQPQAEKPDGCGKRSEMKRNESSQSLLTPMAVTLTSLEEGERGATANLHLLPKEREK